MRHTSYFFITYLCCIFATQAQSLNDLMQDAESNQAERQKVQYTFKGTKIINGHSIENPSKGVLQVMFSHRFSSLQNGVYDLFGLDGASIRIGFDYGITNRVAVGVGRSTMQKAYDGYIKVKILKQDQRGGIPLSITYVSALAVNTLRKLNVPSEDLAYRLCYAQQLLLASKLHERVSVQLMPTLLHRNLTRLNEDPNTFFALGFGGRIKCTKRTAITWEYYHPFIENANQLNYYEAFSCGFDIETGGHVFQLHVTNTSGMIEHQFIGMTNQSFFDGIRSIRLGFNLNRVFTIKSYNISNSDW